MARLEEIPVEELEEALVETDGYREVQRLITAIIYKRGPSVPMLAEWLDKREATIYEWFNRLEDQPIREAIQDEQRPGRPSKLTDEEQDQFETALQESPKGVGYDAPAWTPKLARQYLLDEFDAEYTLRHVRRKMKDAGLSWQTPRPQPPTADEEEREEFRKDLKKTDSEDS